MTKEYIESSPTKLGGIPVLRGTRFSITQLLAELADSDIIEEIAEDFELDANQIKGGLHALSRYFYQQRPRIWIDGSEVPNVTSWSLSIEKNKT